MENPFENARIVGVHTTKQARSLAPRTSFSVAMEALNGALADANMTWDDIDGFGSNVNEWPNNDSEWAYQLNRSWRWSNRGIDPSALMEAAEQISRGRLNAVALVMTGVRPTTVAIAPWLDHESQWTAWAGSLPDQPIQFGLVARRYINEVGPKALEAMAAVAASTRNYGSANPDAVFFGRGPFTTEDVLNSRPIADPLTLLMCSVVSDGGGAIILTHKDRLKDSDKRGVKVVCGDSLVHYAAYQEPPFLDGYYELSQRFRDTLRDNGVKNDDIDVIEFYDHFASHVLLQYETFGFCGKGEGADLALSGAMRLDGKWPTCTDGGNLSFTHPGFPIMFRYIEAVRQLRGEVKDMCPDGNHTYDQSTCRKVRDANLAFVSSPGTPTVQSSFVVLQGD